MGDGGQPPLPFITRNTQSILTKTYSRMKYSRKRERVRIKNALRKYRTTTGNNGRHRNGGYTRDAGQTLANTHHPKSHGQQQQQQQSRICLNDFFCRQLQKTGNSRHDPRSVTQRALSIPCVTLRLLLLSHFPVVS